MNPELPDSQKERLEARVTAYLLGELPPDEAAIVHIELQHDPALKQYTIGSRLLLGW